LTADDVAALDALLIVQTGAVTTAFNRLKQTPGPARPETIRQWTDRLDWLTGLRYISSSQIRRTIRAETTKIESFNDFLDWITFGGPIIKSGDPVEQEKQLKYATLVANSIMLSNVSDLSEVLSSMSNDGHPVTAELAAATSPYMRKNIRRFGKYGLDMEEMPAPLFPQPLPFKMPL
jgi:hypothetical protein